MSILALASVTSFVVAFFLLPFIIRYSEKRKLLVVPGKRRIHKKITPSLGGAAIFLGFAVSVIVWIDISQWSGSFLFVSILVIPFIFGLLDDLTHLRPRVKLGAQLITASLIFFSLDIRLTSLYGLHDSNFNLVVSYLATVVTIVIITNSFNLIDGIDGLAGSFSFLAILFLGAWFFLVDNLNYAMLSFAFLGGIFAFLVKNWEPSKIFMGDTGSLIIGTALSVFIIQFLNDNFLLPAEAWQKFDSSIGTAFCILIIPLTDTLRIIIIRLSKGVSPLKADKRHIHHALIRMGLRHSSATLLLCLVHVFFLGLAILLRELPDRYLLSCVIVMAIALCLILDRILFKHAFR